MNRRFNRLDPRDVIPSRHSIFIRGLPGNTDTAKLKEVFSKDIGAPCSVDFFSASENGTRLSIAIRFESHESAKEMLMKYNGKKLLGFPVQITWFKDLKKGPEPGGYRRRDGPVRGRGTFRGSIRGQLRAMYDRRQRGFDERIDRRRDRSSASSGGNRSLRQRGERRRSGEDSVSGSESRSCSQPRTRHVSRRDFKEERRSGDETIPASYNSIDHLRERQRSVDPERSSAERQSLQAKRRVRRGSARHVSASSHSEATSGSPTSSSSGSSSHSSSSIGQFDKRKGRVYQREWSKEAPNSALQLGRDAQDDSAIKSSFSGGKILLNGPGSPVSQPRRSSVSRDDVHDANAFEGENTNAEVSSKPAPSMASNFFNSFIAEPDLDSANETAGLGSGNTNQPMSDDAELGSSLVSGLIHLNKRAPRIPNQKLSDLSAQSSRGESISRRSLRLDERLPTKRQRVNSPQMPCTDRVQRSGSSGSLSSSPIVERRRGRRKQRRASATSEADESLPGSQENERNHFSDRPIISPTRESTVPRRFKQIGITPEGRRGHSPSPLPLFPAGAEVPRNARAAPHRTSTSDRYSDDGAINNDFKCVRDKESKRVGKRGLAARQRHVSSSEASPMTPRTPPISHGYFADAHGADETTSSIGNDKINKEATTAGLLDLSYIAKKPTPRDSHPVTVRRPSSKRTGASDISSPVSLPHAVNDPAPILDDASPPSITTRVVPNRPATRVAVSKNLNVTEPVPCPKIVDLGQVDAVPVKMDLDPISNISGTTQETKESQMTTNEKLERIRERKDALASEYKRDCETFTSVVRTLISKDSELESRLLALLKEILQERGARCVEELRGLIAESQEILNDGMSKDIVGNDLLLPNTNSI